MSATRSPSSQDSNYSTLATPSSPEDEGRRYVKRRRGLGTHSIIHVAVSRALAGYDDDGVPRRKERSWSIVPPPPMQTEVEKPRPEPTLGGRFTGKIDFADLPVLREEERISLFAAGEEIPSAELATLLPSPEPTQFPITGEEIPSAELATLLPSPEPTQFPINRFYADGMTSRILIPQGGLNRTGQTALAMLYCDKWDSASPFLLSTPQFIEAYSEYEFSRPEALTHLAGRVLNMPNLTPLYLDPEEGEVTERLIETMATTTEPVMANIIAEDDPTGSGWFLVDDWNGKTGQFTIRDPKNGNAYKVTRKLFAQIVGGLPLQIIYKP